MGSLQVKNGRYYGSIYDKSKKKHIQRALGVSVTDKNSETKAQRALKKLERELKNGETTEWHNISFCDFLKEWLRENKDFYKPSTWEGYEKVVTGKILPYFEKKNYKLGELKGKDFSTYFSYLKSNGKCNGEGGLGKKTIINIRGVLSAALKYAVQNDMIEYNYIDRSQLPKFDEVIKEERTVYTEEEIKNLLSYAKETNSKMLLFLYLAIYTGARKGELLGLTWDCIDFKNKQLTIRQNRTGSKKEVLSVLTTPKSKNSTRILPLPSEIIVMLKAEKKKQENMKKFLGDMYINEKYDYVIRKDDGSCYNPNSVNRIIKRIAVAVGLPPCRVHDFRHAFASILFENDTSLKDVSQLLGHGQTSTTERIYVHKKRVGNIESINTIANVIGF